MKHKIKSLRVAVLALFFPLFTHSASAAGATETTQIANSAELALSYVKQAQAYIEQGLQYKKQIEQFKLEDLASELFVNALMDAVVDNVSEDTLNLMDDMLEVVEIAKDLEDFRGMNREELADALANRKLSKALKIEAEEQSEMNIKAMERVKESAVRLRKLQAEITKYNINDRFGANKIAQLQAQIDIAIAAEEAAKREDETLRDQLKAKEKVTESEKLAAQQALFEKDTEYEQERINTIRADNSGTFGVMPSF